MAGGSKELPAERQVKQDYQSYLARKAEDPAIQITNQARVLENSHPHQIEEEEEEEDDIDRAEKFAKTDLYRERCDIFREALFSIDLALDSFVAFCPLA